MSEQDGFRPRRVRPKGWLNKAIKDGFVADPDNPIDTTGLAFDGEKLVKLGSNAFIVEVPTATAKGQGE